MTDSSIFSDSSTQVGSDPFDESSAVRALEESKQYGRKSLACDLCDRMMDLTFLAIAAFMLAEPLDAWLMQFDWLSNTQSYARLACLFVIIYFMHLLISMPLSFYSGYIVEHRFGLSNQSKKRWLRQYALRHVLGVVFGMLMYAGLFWFIWNMGNTWWIAAAGVGFVVSILLGQLMPVLIMPLFQKVEKLEDDALQQRFDKLTDGTGLSIEGVYRLCMSEDTSKANAMLAGLGKTRRVLLGDTLLDSFSPEEIDVIFAHEIGHHVHRHIPKLMVFGAVLMFSGLWLCSLLLQQWTGVEAAMTPTGALPIIMLSLTLFSMVLEPLQNAISRYFERQSDHYALTQTGDAVAYRSAFRKLAKQNKADPNPHSLEVFLFHSHPPLAERIAAAGEVA